ncbi:MAG TPA: hypothetical protein VMF06_17715 [Candidatus Limnocylindria bacterium]|jgi:hypothetical protein|nr:hypothetical protein [Candidatus Limnocylindria bacterium]
MLYLFTVTGQFRAKESGPVMVRGASVCPGSPVLSPGTKIRLQPPTGGVIDTFIQRFRTPRARRAPREVQPEVWLPKKIAPEQVPVGTQVYLLDASYRLIPPPAA